VEASDLEMASMPLMLQPEEHSGIRDPLMAFRGAASQDSRQSLTTKTNASGTEPANLCLYGPYNSLWAAFLPYNVLK